MTDWLPELSDDDLDTLGEALEAWEHKDVANSMFADLIGAMITPHNPQALADLHQQREADKLERKREAAVRKDRSITLRAKLIALRNRRRVERIQVKL